jgi:hypothetical protein
MNLPEDTLNEILKHIDDLPTLIYYCNTNKKLLKLCSSEDFWAYKLEQYQLPMPSINMSLSMWFKLYSKIIKIDKWLNSKNKNITLYYNEIGDDIVISLILLYEMYSRSNIPIGDKNDKLSYIHIRRSDKEFLVSVYLKNDNYSGGIFNIDGLFNFLYQLEILNL